MKKYKAVITSAGKGTRFLPVSSAYQKEMVPLMNKPQLQCVIEEAMASGIEEIAVVVREDVNTFEKYLENDDDLFESLKKDGKENLMDSWIDMKRKADITIFKQKRSDPYGNGTPFLLAKDFIGNDSAFLAIWGDDIMLHTDKTKPTCINQLIDYYEKYSPSTVMSTQKVAKEEINRYGSYEYYSDEEAKVPFHARSLVEKPEPDKAPSLYANACRFLLTTDVIEELSLQIKGLGGEIWLTDAVNRLMQKGKVVIAAPWEGSEWLPVGDPLRWLKANIKVALESDEYKEDLRSFLKALEL